MELNVYVIAIWATAVLALIVGFYALRHKQDGDWTIPFALLAFCVAWWSFLYGLEIASPTLTLKTVWAKLEYIGIAIIPVAWFLFAIHYAGRTEWWTLRKQQALFIIPFLTIVIVLTNDMHHLNWAAVDIDRSGQFAVMDVSYGIWFWIHSVYSYFFILIGTIVLIQGYFRFPAAYRKQHATLLIGVFIPWISNAIYLSGLSPFPNLDLSPFGLALSTFLVGLSVFGLGLFNIVPVARRVVVDNMKEGVIVLDLNNQIVDINPAATAVFQQDNLIGTPIADVLQDYLEIINAFREVDSNQKEIELILNGEWRVFEVDVSPIYNPRGDLNGRLIVFYDITRRKATEAALAQARDEALEATRIKTELLARVSHELRTPLNVILGYTEMLQEGLYGELYPKQWEPTNKIIESTTFLTKQVNELLDISRLDIGQLELELDWFEIPTLIERVYSQMKILADGRNLRLNYMIDPNLATKIYNDAGRVEQVLLNLVGNAIKFSEQGTVTIEVCQQSETHWAFCVSDEGLGIPESAHTLIFEPFRRVDSSLMRTQVGTGLGLAIVKQLVTLMQGVVDLESRVGEGTKFTVTLPFVSAE